jgi:DNA-binding NarL/FixJ family response regulator
LQPCKGEPLFGENQAIHLDQVSPQRAAAIGSQGFPQFTSTFKTLQKVRRGSQMEERKKNKTPIILYLSEPMMQRLELNRKANGFRSVEEVIQEAINQYLAGEQSEPVRVDPLTPRQRQVLHLIADGKKTKEIASQLKISVKTVEMHRTQLMETLDLHNIAELVRYAIRIGLIVA